MKTTLDTVKKLLHREIQNSEAHVTYDELDLYSFFRAEVISTFTDLIKNTSFDIDRVHHLLNGGASQALHKHISRETRSKFGIFFSGQKLAAAVASLIQHKISQGAVLADPACGAGDLLLACLSHMPLQDDLQSTLSAWGERTIGLDIHAELAGATRERIALLAASRLRVEGSNLSSYTPTNLKNSLIGIRTGDYFSHQELFANADCVVMNPPFIETDAPEGCNWSSGKVQLAALFTANTVSAAKVNQEIVAVLPDVLRSGTRYKRWREMISESSDVLGVNIFGRFDSKTDVDVFILHLRKRVASTVPKMSIWQPIAPELPNSLNKQVISDLFKVSVGAVVPHRHKNEGPWAAYLDVSCTPANTEIKIFKNRRFKGTLHKGPFVTIRRTSSPTDSHRAISNLINTTSYVAVENHLIVLQPHDGTLKSCRKLVDMLRQSYVDVWLNTTIRCRHLTTKSIKELPLGEWA